MAQIIYGLCTLTSLACAWMLLGTYRRNGVRLLFWSGLCFVGMSVNNVLLVLDKLVLPQVDLLPLRLISALVALLLLLFGLIYENN
jgi:hydrogenase/urease accessory protein HupE